MVLTGHAVTVSMQLVATALAERTRLWATHQTISDPIHVEAAKVLRRRRIQIPPTPLESEVPVRDPSSYDTAVGVDLDGGAA